MEMKNEMSQRSFLGSSNDKVFNKTANKIKPTNFEFLRIRLAQICEGQIFGEEDVVNGRPATSSITCLSTKATLYASNADEFLAKMCTTNNEKTWDMIVKTVLRKDIQTK